MKQESESLKLHKKLRGKITVKGKNRISYDNLSLLYTPGVSEPCLEIAENKETAYTYTWKWNSVAVISDGSRVLGLGNIGPTASLPLLEGKAIIFSEFGGLDAIPLPIASLSVDETVSVIKSIQYGFGGINLEDISTPRCYDILERLTQELDIPVWHDDQQGTATIIVAALINAIKIVKKEFNNINIVLYGAGAANSAVYRLLKVFSVNGDQIKVFDKKGILGAHRNDLTNVNVLKNICNETNPKGLKLSVEDCLKEADVLIALSQSGPGIIKPEQIKLMKQNPIVFACANPIPEINPETAKAAGAAIVATGTSLYNNQVNNALVFPGMYRGALDVRAKSFTWGMCKDVAYKIASLAEKRGLNTEYIVPKIDETMLHFEIALAAAKSAIKEGVAQFKIEETELKQIILHNLNYE